MGVMSNAIDANLNVSINTQCASYFSGGAPEEMSSIIVVEEKFFDPIVGELHWIVLCPSL